MLLWLIVACEIGFWIVLLLGLIARYGLDSWDRLYLKEPNMW